MAEEKQEFNFVRNFIENTLDRSLDDSEVEELMAYALRQDGYENNKGYMFQRTAHNPREMAFYEQWKKENFPQAGINNGQGILQDLFIESKLDGFTRKWMLEITNRDRMIVATVIQWLGSNVGMAFLDEALARFGARIVYKP